MRIARHFIALAPDCETAEDFDFIIQESMACALMDQMSMATHSDEQTSWIVCQASAHWNA